MARKNEAHDIVIESITGALLMLMQKKPISEINISELCSRAGVSRVSFYRNFSSLDEILTVYLKKCTDDWWEEFCKKDEAEFRAKFWEDLLAQYRKHEDLIHLLQQNNRTYIIKDHIFSCCGPKPEHDERMAYTCALIAGAIYGYVDEWIRRGMKDSPMQIDLRNLISLTEM